MAVRNSPLSKSPEYAVLLNKVRKTLVEGQQRIEQERVRTYWETGKVIHTDILKHKDRAYAPAAPSDSVIDLGFKVAREADVKLLSSLKDGDIIESRPKDDAYKFYKVDRTAKDLFTCAAYIEKVIDGDTFNVWIDLGFNTWIGETLRLRGLDCPEVGTKEGDEAKVFVQSLLKESQLVIIRSSKAEKYGRYLADVYIPQGEEPDPETDIYLNNLLLETGRAVRM